MRKVDSKRLRVRRVPGTRSKTLIVDVDVAQKDAQFQSPSSIASLSPPLPYDSRSHSPEIMLLSSSSQTIRSTLELSTATTELPSPQCPSPPSQHPTPFTYAPAHESRRRNAEQRAATLRAGTASLGTWSLTGYFVRCARSGCN